MALLQFPIGGVHKGAPAQKQPPFTTPRALNVWGRDALYGKTGGGQRWGTSKAFSTQLGNGDHVINGGFSADTDWTKGAGWNITASQAVTSGSLNTDLTQTVANLVAGGTYTVQFTLTRTTGSITVNLGGTPGTTRSSGSLTVYTETIVCGPTAQLKFTTSNFAGSIDSVSATLTSGAPIRLLALCETTNTTGSVTSFDDFVGSALSSSWTTAGFTIDGAAVTGAPLVSGGQALCTASATAEQRAAYLSGVTDISTTAYRRISVTSALANGSASGERCRLYLDLNNAALSESSCIYLTATPSAIGWILDLVVNGSTVLSRTIAATPATSEISLWIDANSTVHASVNGVEQITSNQPSWTPPAAARVGFALTKSANTNRAPINDFTLTYFSTSAVSPPTMLMASAKGILYRQTTTGIFTAVGNSAGVSLASDRPLEADGFLQKLYIADYGKAASGTNASVSTSGSSPNFVGTLTDGGASFITAGVTVADYRLEVLSGTGATIGVFAITARTATTITYTGGTVNPGTAGSGVSYRVCRAAKVYDSSTDQIALVPIGTQGDATNGQFPLNCSLLARFGSSLVWAGDADYPQFAYMSQDGNEASYGYGGTDPTSAFAWDPVRVAGSSAIGEPITCIFAKRDDYFIFGCRRAIFIQKGRPPGGRLDPLTDAVGLPSGKPWARLPDGSLFLVTTDGFYTVDPQPEAFPVPVSRDRLPRELINLQTNFDASNVTTGIDLSCEYSSDRRMIDVFVTPRSGSQATHYTIDTYVPTPTGQYGTAIWYNQLPATQQPTCLLLAAKSDGTQVAMQGCRDGLVRCFDYGSSTDDGTAISSRVVYGPFAISGDPNREGSLDIVALQLMPSSGSVRVYAATGWGAESAITNSQTELTESALPISGTDQVTMIARMRGTHAIVELVGYGDGAWCPLTLIGTARDVGPRRMG